MTMKSWLLAAIVLCCFTIFSCNQGSGSSTGSEAPTYQEQVMSIEEIEKSRPTSFLSAGGTYKENFWGDQIKISCTVSNSATVATYKDAVIQFTYYSKTKTVLSTHKETLYELFPPSSSKTFQMKIPNYKNVNSVGWDVIDANPAN